MSPNNYDHESKEFLRKESCPQCGSKDNVSVYWNSNLQGETKFCHTPDCDYSVTDSDLRHNTKVEWMPLAIYDFPPEGRTMRKISGDTMRKYSVSVDAANVVHFPYGFSRDGLQVQGYKCWTRDREGNKKLWSKGHIDGKMLFGKEVVESNGKNRKVVVITEGEWDALAVAEMTGYAAVSLPTGAQSAEKCLKYNATWLEENFEKIILCFDSDRPGKIAADKCMDLFKPEKVFKCVLDDDLKDANEYLCQGKAKEFKDALWNAKPLTIETLVTGQDLYELMYAYWKNKDSGILLGIPALDDKFSLRPGEITTIIGDTSVGKSTLARQMVSNLLKQGYKVATFSNEECAADYALRIVFMSLGIDYDRVTDEYLQKYSAEVQDLLSRLTVYHGSTFDVDAMQRNIEFCYRVKGVDCIIFDNLTGAFGTSEGLKEDVAKFYMMLNGLNTLYEKHSIVVSHIRRDEKLKDDEVPSLHHAYGTGNIERLSHNVLSVARSGFLLLGECLKRRHNGKLFSFTLKFNPDIMGYEECMPPHRVVINTNHKESSKTNAKKTIEKTGELRFSTGKGCSLTNTKDGTNTKQDTTSDIRDNPETTVQSRLSNSMQKGSDLRGGQGGAGQKDYRTIEKFNRPPEKLFDFVRREPHEKILKAMHEQHRAMGEKERH